ncbi:hypothetical protein RHMOL_Rhmol02G0159700 [Rhododendron molle]|uniref:Uncharacterized protein n=1 Tax=Rhododendron molle TaxID=49168 RepID=A0ACC0PS20_RHOML|nr:hypothetical protein RHMOL_Rhmol02G0159700 [Rhododendron molle]
MQQNQSLLTEAVLALQKKSTTPPPPQAETEGTHPSGSQTETRDNQIDLNAYVRRFRELSVDVQEPISEDRLAKICVDGMQPAFKPHLATHHFPDFSALYEAARNLNETVEPPLPPPRYQHSPHGRHPGSRQTAYAASGPPPSRSRGYPAKRPKYNEPPPLPVTAAEAQAFLDAWVQDRKVSLPEARKEPTRRDMEHPDYCIYHRMVRHPTKDCWGLQTLFEKFMVEEAVELTATKDVLRNPLPNHKDNGKAVMMEGSPSTSNPNEKKRARDAIMAKARAPAEVDVGPKVVKYTRPDATLASKVEVSEVPAKIEILKRSVPCSVAEIFPEEAIDDWRTPISNELKSPSAAITLRNLKHFTIYQGVLYYRGSGGLLARCVGEEEAKIKVQEVHEQSCGTGDISLYRRLQRQGYYWPTMATDAAELQSKCSKCRETPSKAECNFIGVYTDWRKPYIDFLTDGTLPPDQVDIAIVNK